MNVKPTSGRALVGGNRSLDAVPDGPAASDAPAPAPVAADVERHMPLATTMPAAFDSFPSHASLPLLVDYVLASGDGQMASALVVASADHAEVGGTIVDSIVDDVQQRGLRVLKARLEMVQGGQVKLQAVPATSGDGDSRSAAASSLPTLLIPVLQSGQLRAEFDAWLDRACRVADFVLLEGPPLARTMLSATLAGSSTGLLLVMQAGTTSKAELSVASERARSAGARLLGVVVRRKRLRLPAWLKILQRS